MKTTRLRAAAVGVVLLTVGVMTGCGNSQGPDAAFCEMLDSDEYTTAVDPTNGVPIGDYATAAVDVLHDLRSVAPPEAYDDIDTMIDGYEAFASITAGMEVDDPATNEATQKLSGILEAHAALDTTKSEVCTG